MCYFITLVAPTDDVTAVRAVMQRHGRTAELIDNPSVRRALSDGERQYLTTPGHCDCGTILAPRHESPEAFDDALAKHASRMKRKGWSDAKIARAVEDRRKADARPSGGSHDSLELWQAALRELLQELNLPHVGLLLRSYWGVIATEVFDASRRDVPPGPWPAALASLKQDQVTIFR
jgi:hypothetical protein